MMTELKPVEPSAPVCEVTTKEKSETELSCQTTCAVVFTVVDVISSFVGLFVIFLGLLEYLLRRNRKSIFDSYNTSSKNSWTFVQITVFAVMLEATLLGVVQGFKGRWISDAIEQLSAAPLLLCLIALRTLILFKFFCLLVVLCDRAFDMNYITSKDTILPLSTYFGLSALYFYVEILSVKCLRERLNENLPQPSVTVTRTVTRFV